ncbi:hypothetical protein L1049_001690 [Liquidambar formosana]|uniref:Uncharacterized protein n=1 Tax=Liquidambar formosana TaxID=63359 RepID=A0AAP0N878_LIQFO
MKRSRKSIAAEEDDDGDEQDEHASSSITDSQVISSLILSPDSLSRPSSLAGSFPKPGSIYS